MGRLLLADLGFPVATAFEGGSPALSGCVISDQKYFWWTMNFLLRSTQTAVVEQRSVKDYQTDGNYISKPEATLKGIIAEDPFLLNSTSEYHDGEADGIRGENGGVVGPSSKIDSSILENHIDVTEDEGFLTIPCKELPDNWSEAPNILSYRSLDRFFVFPGEQVHILACLSACKQDTEIITPFKVAAVMSKNGIGQTTKTLNGNIGHEINRDSGRVAVGSDAQEIDQNSENLLKDKIDPQKDISASESLLRMEDHRRQTETLLRRFRNSHFFVRIAESDEPLWSKRNALEASLESSEIVGKKFVAGGEGTRTPLTAVIDYGNFDASVSGGLARNAVKCCSLSNGDIVVLLQVNVGVDFVRNPVLEILQFEKYQHRNLTSENQDNLDYINQDPCGELLKWLLPLDNSIPSPSRPLSPPPLSSSSNIRTTPTKPNFSTSSGSQLFSFGHFRSYSMSSLPPNTAPSPPVTTPSSRPNFDQEDWDQFSSHKFMKNQKSEGEALLSFRGVSLEPERFSVCCGLEGIYVPGRRWRRKLEIIQPVEIHSFAADCNTDDLLCVQIKNVSPAHTPDIVVYLDAITIIFEEASKGGPPLSLPIACVEAGNEHSLPNLALRRGEEHSFILKPATSMWKSPKGHGERSSQSSCFQPGSASTSLHLPSNIVEGKLSASTADQYAILVSCRCNYTESRLFFKQPTSWRPRISRDLMISVASEMSRQTLGSSEGVPQLPVQVLTLQASNLTSKDLTLTVLAPASFTSPPSVVSLSSSPSKAMSPFAGSLEFAGGVDGERRGSAVQRLSSAPLVSENQRKDGDGGQRSVSFNEQASPTSDALPCTDLGCTHLWLQSRVPLGCVPSQSTATIKLELLPLTDGIISVDSLQIDVKEKGLTYIPEHSLKINATSSIATGII
ncbi:hypothetical protein F0562_032865 [Nyssa sinensis]|uniref:Uncharacterized protein n=1 Tax=Nyssa sinensis TaxID=561372 RepID=A0A5J5ARX9_9ASTE|nr:hypothetical protein F0562_032865 [Nyssa sinensis]